MNSLENMQALREALLKKFGSLNVDRQVCEQLSITIFTKQADYVSTTTLMRLFGLLPMEKRVFPPQVLAMLCEFVNCRNKLSLDPMFRSEMQSGKIISKGI